MKQAEIAFVGAGNMATSLILGLLKEGTNPATILACDPSQEQLDRLQAQLPDGSSIQLSSDNASVAGVETLVLAVKPQVMREVAQQIKLHLTEDTLVISIAAGISLAALEKWLGSLPMVRCMPNTPALVQCGASGLFANQKASETQKQKAQNILDAVGMSLWLENEKQIDAVTAVSGSGPAYFFLLLEAMINAGEELGLSEEVARQLAIKTCAGAAKLAEQSEVSIAQLRQQVTSPGGTTERALASFQKDDFNAVVARALRACADRAAELESSLGNQE